MLKRKNAKIEMCVIILCIIAFCVGCLLEIQENCEMVLGLTSNTNGFLLAILQIQASIVTLTIAIVALLSGNISDSYKGVSISDYVLEIRPQFFTQKTVILLEFAMLIINIIFYMFGLYNMVISVFFSALIIIVLSICSVYSIFMGRLKLQAEIDVYIEQSLSDDQLIEEITEGFLVDWKRETKTQSGYEFEKYEVTFNEIVIALLERKKIQYLNHIQEEMSSFLLQDDSSTCRKNGLNFVYNRYQEIWRWIFNHQDLANGFDERIILLGTIDRKWYLAMNSLSSEEVEELLRWVSFTDYVIRVSCWVHFDVEEKQNADVASLERIARTFGGYISRQKSRGNLVETERWEAYLKNNFYGSCNVPNEAAVYYGNAKAIVGFNFCRGLILECQLEIIKNGFFLDGVGNLYDLNSQAYLKLILMVHIYLYYIAYRESEACVDIELKMKAKALLTDKQVIRTIENLVTRLDRRTNLLDCKLEAQLEEGLRMHELFPKHANAKSLIIDTVVREYYLYLVLHVAHTVYEYAMISAAIDTEVYFPYLVKDGKQELKSKFIELDEIFSEKTAQREKNVESMLDLFYETKKKDYLEHRKKEESLAQKFYIENNTEAKVIAKTNEFVTGKFKSVFADVLREQERWALHKEVHVLRLLDYTRLIGETPRGGIISDSLGYFMDWLIKELHEEHYIEKLEISDSPKGDKKLEEYLKQKNFTQLMGSSCVFRSRDYTNWQERSQFLDDYSKVFVQGSRCGLAIKKDGLSIRLNSVNTEINPVEIDDMELDKSSDGKIVYEDNNIEMEFEEGELREYLHNLRKQIDVYFDVSIAVKDKEMLGAWIQRSVETIT